MIYFLKLYFNIIFLCAYISFETFSKINKITISKNETDYIIGEDSPINFIRGYYFYNMNLIYKKIMFTGEFDINCIMKVENEFIKYNYKNKDVYAACSSICECQSKIVIYLNYFRKLLILMFKLELKTTTIVKNESNSFYSFLQDDNVKPIISKLFAALFLLAEGISINLNIIRESDNYYLVLKEKYVKFKVLLKGKKKNFFMKKNDELEVNYSDVFEVIQYFQEISKLWSSIYDEKLYNKSLFLDSGNFLLQTYIYELINDDYDVLKEIIINYFKILKYKSNNRFNELFIISTFPVNDKVYKKIDSFIYDMKNFEELDNIYMLIDFFKNFFRNIISNTKTTGIVDNIIDNTTDKTVDKVMDNTINTTFNSAIDNRAENTIESYLNENDCLKTNRELLFFVFFSLCFYDHSSNKFKTDHLIKNNFNKKLISFYDLYYSPSIINESDIINLQKDWNSIFLSMEKKQKLIFKSNDRIINKNSMLEIYDENNILNILYDITYVCGLENITTDIIRYYKIIESGKIKSEYKIKNELNLILNKIIEKISKNSNLTSMIDSFSMNESKNIVDGNIKLTIFKQKNNELSIIFLFDKKCFKYIFSNFYNKFSLKQVINNQLAKYYSNQSFISTIYIIYLKNKNSCFFSDEKFIIKNLKNKKNNCYEINCNFNLLILYVSDFHSKYFIDLIHFIFQYLIYNYNSLEVSKTNFYKIKILNRDFFEIVNEINSEYENHLKIILSRILANFIGYNILCKNTKLKNYYLHIIFLMDKCFSKIFVMNLSKNIFIKSLSEENIVHFFKFIMPVMSIKEFVYELKTKRQDLNFSKLIKLVNY